MILPAFKLWQFTFPPIFELILLVLFCPVKNVYVNHYSVREILDQMNVFFFSWKMWFNCFIQILALVLSFLPSAVILSVQYAHSNIYRSYIFCHLSLSLSFINISHWSSFFREKKCDLRKWKHLLKSFGSIEANRSCTGCFVGWTWIPGKKPTDGICRWERHDWGSCRLLCLQEEISRFAGIPLLSRN